MRFTSLAAAVAALTMMASTAHALVVVESFSGLPASIPSNTLFCGAVSTICGAYVGTPLLGTVGTHILPGGDGEVFANGNGLGHFVFRFFDNTPIYGSIFSLGSAVPSSFSSLVWVQAIGGNGFSGSLGAITSGLGSPTMFGFDCGGCSAINLAVSGTAPGGLPPTGFLLNGFEGSVVAAVAFDTSPRGVVPEPATWAMMLLGLFGLGSMLRRRRQLALA
jgi:hypothetical protein